MAAQQKKKKQIGVSRADTAGVGSENETVPVYDEQEPVSNFRKTPKDDTGKGTPERRPKRPAAEPERKEKPVKAAPDHKPEPRNDDVVKLLSVCEGNDKVISAAKKHPAFKFMNKEAWEKAVKKKDKIGGGLFRMRIGNMLRGAKTRMKKGK